MKSCSYCEYSFPDSASECLACGGPLTETERDKIEHETITQNYDQGSVTGDQPIQDGDWPRRGNYDPPKLEVNTERIDLGTLMPREDRSWTIIVKNAGGGELTGRVTTSASWIKAAPSVIDPRLHQQAIEIEISPRGLQAGHQYSGLISFYTIDSSKLIPITFTIARPIWRDARVLLIAGAAVLVAAFVFAIVLSIVNWRRNLPNQPTAQAGESREGSPPTDFKPPEPQAEATTLESSSPKGDNPALPPAASTEPEPLPANAAPQQFASLNLAVANVDGAELWVDGESHGLLSQNRVKQFRLPVGSHALRATKNGYTTWERSVSLPANARESLRVSLEPLGPSPEEIAREQQRQAELLAQQREAEQRAQQEAEREREAQRIRDEAARREAQANEASRRPVQNLGVPISMSPSINGKYVLVVLTGRFAEPPGSAGSVEIALSAPESMSNLKNIRGNLPGRPCRITLVPYENVAEHSFAEAPGPGNRWGRATVRIRPKDSKGIIRFAVNWQLISSSPPH